MSDRTADPTEAPPPRARPQAEEGGDDACWLSLVCPECGRVAEGRPGPVCAICGAAMPER